MKKIKAFVFVLLFILRAFQADVPTNTFAGIMVSRSSNYVIAFNQPFPFNSVRLGSASMWSVSDPTKIQIPYAGVWTVGAEITTLGLNYASIGGLDNSRVILEIVKNWNGNEATSPHLQADICAARFEPQNLYGANLNILSCPVALAQGDTIQLLITGKGSLLVESNPNGTGNVSPHFYANFLGQ